MKSYNLNPPFVFLAGIVFLIPFFRVKLQYDFRFYISILYIINLIYYNVIFVRTNKFFEFKGHLFFYLWVLLTVFFSVNLSFSIQYLVNYCFLGIFFIFIIHHVNSYERLMLILKVLIASFAFQIFIVFMQYLGYESFYLIDKEDIGLNTGMNEASTGNIRYWGSFGEALVLSTYLTSIGVGLIIYLLNKYSKKIVTYIVLLIILFSIYLTGSRAGISIFSLLVIIYIYSNRVISRISLFLLVVLITILGYFYLGSLFSSDANLSRFVTLKEGNIRFQLWTQGFKILIDSPLYGSTIGCINYSLKQYNLLPDYATTINASGHVENSYLTILFSTGIVGFLFFIYIVRYPFVLFTKYISLGKVINPNQRALISVFKYAYIALLLCMFTEPSVGVHMRNSMLFMLVNALFCCFTFVYVTTALEDDSKKIKVSQNSLKLVVQ